MVRLAISLVLASGISICVFCLVYARSTGADAKALYVDAESLSFGEVWENEVFTWNLTVENRSEREFHVERWYTTCGCTSVRPSSLIVPSNSSADVTVHLDLSQGRNANTSLALAARDFSVSIVPICRNAMVSEAHWELKGKVRPAYAATPSAVDFGETMVVGHESVGKTLQLTCHPSVTDVDVSSDDATVEVTTERTKEGLNTEYSIHVQPGEPNAPALLNARLLLSGSTVDGDRLPVMTVPVRGKAVDDFVIEPSAAVLGLVRLGESVTERLTVRSRCGAPISVSEISLEEGARESVKVVDSKDKGDNTWEMTVAIEASQVGHITIPLRLRLSVHDRKCVAEVNIDYYGVAD